MNGPEHYREAEGFLARASAELDSAAPEVFDDVAAVVTLAIAAAQVHATLALAAATAVTAQLADEEPPVAIHSDPGWEKVVGFETLRRDGGWTR